LFVVTASAWADSEKWLEAAKVTAPPADIVEQFKLDRVYAKYVDSMGIPVIASAKVHDSAVIEAGYLINLMLQDRADIAATMAKNRTRFVVMAISERTTDVPEHKHLTPKDYWDRRARGLGATRRAPAVSCGEENLLKTPGDPYERENILIHEFSHAIHSMGLREIDKEFDKRLKKCYDDALAKGLWKNAYAATNAGEYWAEAVQSYFNTNRENDNAHNHVNTRAELFEYDPDIARLVAEVFKDAKWEYLPPGKRAEQKHLKGLERVKMERFKW
jgi:hypothetical protein